MISTRQQLAFLFEVACCAKFFDALPFFAIHPFPLKTVQGVNRQLQQGVSTAPMNKRPGRYIASKHKGTRKIGADAKFNLSWKRFRPMPLWAMID